MTSTRDIDLPDGAHLRARIDGPDSAPWVVFSNSVLTDLSIWDSQAQHLKDRYRVLRYDQRGHGGSGLPTGPMTFEDYGADLAALLEALNVERCLFVGLSMGVPTGLAAYALRPDLFAGFVAVDGVCRSAPGREAFWSERRETARSEGMGRIASDTVPRWLPGVEGSDSRAQRLATMISATPLEGFAAATHALGQYDQSEALSALTCPVLGLAGEKDGAMPKAVEEQFGAKPDSRFAVIPDAGHVPNFQSPETFNDTIAPFLDTVAADLKEPQ